MALTAAGLNYISQAVVGLGVPFDNTNAYLGVGDGIQPFSVGDTDLQGISRARKEMDVGYPIVTPPVVTFKSTFKPADANFNWNEWGIFNGSTGGVMLNRVVETNGTKLDNQTWILEVDIRFTLE